MTRGSIREYSEAVRGRYLQASKKEKGRVLDEFTQVTGYHRKAAVRLLRRGKPPRAVKRQGRPRHYGPEVAEANPRLVTTARASSKSTSSSVPGHPIQRPPLSRKSGARAVTNPPGLG